MPLPVECVCKYRFHDLSFTGSSCTWSPQATSTLFHLRCALEKDFIGFKTHTVLWNKIAEDLGKEGHKFTPNQCVNKFKSLKRDYRATVDHNSRTGNDKKTCLFFDEFNQMYGLKASTKPVFTLASDDSQPSQKSGSPKAARSDKGTKRPNPNQWLIDYETRQNEESAKRWAAVQKMHDQKLSFFEKIFKRLDK